MSDLICVFDVGTTGARTIIFDINGKIISKSYQEYPIEKQPTGISEQNPAIWWNAIKNTCNQVVKQGKFDLNDVVGISAAFHRCTITLITKEGNILHPALTWLDEREVTDIKEYQETGGLRRAIPKLLWLKNNKSDLFNKTWKIIQPDSYIYYKLCGEIITDPTFGIWGILNQDTLDWDEKLADLYELPIDLWPKIGNSGDIVGELSNEAANELGLKRNLPIVLGGGDQQCSALGLGVVENGQVKITSGTGTFIDYVVDKPAKVVGDIPLFSLPHVIKGKWLIEGAVPGTGTVLKWFRDNFSQLQIKECNEKNIDIFDNLISEATEIPIGSEGLLFIPLYIFRKGTIYGLSFNHTRAHFIRAIMESASLTAQMYLVLIEGIGGTKSKEVIIDGGASKSGFWCQIFADILNKKVLIPEVNDGAALGAGMLGFYGCGQYKSITSAVDNMVNIIETKTPIKENNKKYKKLIRIFTPAVLNILNKKRITGKL
ncbi:MAG: FGGY-family carbohydrate kinase [Candidatus Helarchaeota archaeon]